MNGLGKVIYDLPRIIRSTRTLSNICSIPLAGWAFAIGKEGHLKKEYCQEITKFKVRQFKMSTLFDEHNKVVSLCVGAPNPPLLQGVKDLMQTAIQHLLGTDTTSMMQYGPRLGEQQYINEVAIFLSDQYNDDVKSEEILLNAGATQGLNFVIQKLFHPGDYVFMEDPSYFIAIKILRDDFGLNVIPVSTNEDGINVEELDKLMTKYAVKEKPLSENKPFSSLLYVIPTFNNPTGDSMSSENSQRLIAVLRKHKVLALCDDVYNCVYFMEDKPPFVTRAPKRLYAYDVKTDEDYQGNVVSNGTFSKILGPGLRLGWIEAPKHLINIFQASGYLASGGSCNHFTSCALTYALKLGDVAQHLEKSREAYHSRMTAMCNAIDKYIPNAVYRRPKGGYFIWITLPEEVDSVEFGKICLEKYKVKFWPGPICSVTAGFHNCIRFSFAYHEESVLYESIQKIGMALNEYMHGK